MLKKHTNSHDAPSRSRVYHVGKERRVATQNANLGMRGCRGREGGSCFLFTSGSEMTTDQEKNARGDAGGGDFSGTASILILKGKVLTISTRLPFLYACL